MRDKIQKIVVEATAGTKDITLAIDELLLLCNVSGELPLSKEHQCFDKGHSMFSVYHLNNDRSHWGISKCGRCGHEEHWQYDF